MTGTGTESDPDADPDVDADADARRADDGSRRVPSNSVPPGVGGVHLSPADAALRGLLELVALVALGYWGWTSHAGLARVAWAAGVPLLAAVLWGWLRVPGDPGSAPVAVPGPVRLALELTLFGAASLLLVDAGRPLAGGGLAAIVAIHYLASLDRVRWLLGR